MKKGNGEHGQYVRQVQENTQRYSQNLLHENERLRTTIASLEASQVALAARLAAHAAGDRRQQDLQGQVRRLEDERSRLLAELDSARGELRQRESQQETLETKLRVAEADSQRFARSYVDVERQNANLANLYVASYQLHGTLDRGEVIAAIKEIIANLVGCEEVALFEVESGAECLRLAAAVGVDPARFEHVALGSGVIGNAALSGEIFIAGETSVAPAPHDAHLTACIPVKLGGRTTHVIALFRLLAHKPALEDLDRELFDLLANQAGMALYCTKLHAVAAAKRPR